MGEQEHLVERAVPLGHRDAAHVEVVAGATAARPRDGDQVGRPLASQDLRCRVRAFRIREDVGRLVERAQRAFERGQRGGIASVPDPGAHAAERPAQHGSARRSIGLRQALGDDEAGDDQHGAGPGQRAGRRLGAARPEESRDAPPGGIESEQVVDRVKAGAGGGHGSGRYHTLRLTS
jgi:hypothetical protein